MAGHKSLSYFKIYLLLLGLFLVSVAGPEIADHLHLTGSSRLITILITAFGIALVKAYYVCAYFMHLKFEKIYAPYILLACVALLFIFFFGVATDSMKHEGRNWVKTYVDPVHAPGEGGEGHGSSHGEVEHAAPEAHSERGH